jgi:hypothetical protein
LRQALGGDAALARVLAALVRPSLRTSLRVNTAAPTLQHRSGGGGATMMMTPEQAALADVQALLPRHTARLHPSVPAALVVAETHRAPTYFLRLKHILVVCVRERERREKWRLHTVQLLTHTAPQLARRRRNPNTDGWRESDCAALGVERARP